jgi:anti-anti-sigma factor
MTRGAKRKGENVMLKIYAKNLGNIAILSLQGRIVIGETEILRNAVDSLCKTGVTLDLAGVTTVDAHGLGVLLDLRQRTLAKGMRFELMNVSKPMSRVLEICKLETVFQITSTVEFFPAMAREQRASFAALKSCA